MVETQKKFKPKTLKPKMENTLNSNEKLVRLEAHFMTPFKHRITLEKDCNHQKHSKYFEIFKKQYKRTEETSREHSKYINNVLNIKDRTKQYRNIGEWLKNLKIVNFIHEGYRTSKVKKHITNI